MPLRNTTVLRCAIVVSLFCCLLVTTSRELFATEQPATGQVDIILRGATVIDGSGQPRHRADVAIKGSRIVALGDLGNTKAKQTIDANGKILCPGFIDLHSHADRGILAHRDAENYIRQGVTTLVCGNCGSSPTDVAAFFKDLRRDGIGPNLALLVGHGSIRKRVMGRLNAPPSPEQLQKMQQLVRQAMKDGASGLSTSLRYGPGTYATTDEIVALAKEVKPFGGFYATHMRDEGTRILEAVEESLQIGQQSGIPVHISHHKISSASVFGLTRLTLARIDKARAAGRDVTLDQYPYGAGSGGMDLYVPQWSLSGGMDAFRARLKQPQVRKRIEDGVKDLLLRKIYEANQRSDNPTHTAAALSRIRVARAIHDESLEGKTLTQILRERKQTVALQQGCDLLIELISKGTTGINHTLEERPGGDVDRVMQHPQTCVASDGSVFQFGTGNPHPRSYGCFTRTLGHYVRQRQLLTLEQAIQKMTQLPATRMGWSDRGLLTANAIADIVIFDPKTVTDKATFLNPHQYSTGIEYVLVNGRLVLKAGKMTGQRPGEPVSPSQTATRD